ncbi:MAG: DNA-processing protein DprA [Lautropia sp.]|nr:DNA-processing protein DprA [Lautropia sp.]
MPHTPINPSSEVNLPPGTDDEDMAAWLRLTLTPGIGPVTGQHLLRHLGPPDQIFRTPRSHLRTLLNKEALVSALLDDDPERERQIEQALAWRGGRRHLLALDDTRYPQALLHLTDPPLLIHAEGDLSALQQPRSIAVVGSRRASTEGLRNAFAFADALARRGILITSGLAEGIDAAAHEGALAGAPANVPGTIAVLGNGIDHIYPSQNQRLADEILARHGLILSELPLGTAPTRAGFPRRNRLIAALSQAVLVVEAAMQSGSLITARLGTELGRDVMAIPGSIHNPQSRGCHHLIRQGAQLVDCVDDILQALGVNAGVPGTTTTGNGRPRRTGPSSTSGRLADRDDSPMQPGSRIVTRASPDDDMARGRTSGSPASDAREPARPRKTLPPRRIWASPASETTRPQSGTTSRTTAPATPSSPDTTATASPFVNQPDERQQLLACLAGSPQSTDALAQQLGWPAAQVLVTVQLLEMLGQVSRQPDGRWQRVQG